MQNGLGRLYQRPHARASDGSEPVFSGSVCNRRNYRRQITKRIGVFFFSRKHKADFGSDRARKRFRFGRPLCQRIETEQFDHAPLHAFVAEAGDCRRRCRQRKDRGTDGNMTRKQTGCFNGAGYPVCLTKRKNAFSAPPQLLDFIESGLWAG